MNAMTKSTPDEFEYRGVHHVALVCKDMARTVKFYRDVLGMKLVKTLDLPRGMGQHFFFDLGKGDALAFFWFPDAPDGKAGESFPKALPGEGSFVTANGSMNHLAFDVPAEKFVEYHARLVAKGVVVTPIRNHDNSSTQISEDMNEGVYIRSFYFYDPDGVCLEFACWTGALKPSDVSVEAMTAKGEKATGVVFAGA
jgi:catechol 2,3-dioxygenase-like lactoylglutathione lyase family enzyme